MAIGEYLTFLLGSEIYGLDMGKVQEVVGGMTVARMPHLPPCVRGLINLRGQLLSVFDLRMKFGLPQQEDSSRTCIVIVQLPLGSGVAACGDFPAEELTADGGHDAKHVLIGILVDQVRDVVSIHSGAIEPAADLETDVGAEFLAGAARHGQDIVHLLAGDRVFPVSETEAFIPKASAAK